MQGRIWYCRKAGDIVGIKVPQYRWAKTIKELDGNKCAFCGSIERIEAHHIQQKAEAEAVSTDLENGITLCHKCHYTAHGADFTTNHRKMPDWRGLFTTEPEIMQAFIADYAAQKVVIAVPKGRKDEIQVFAAQTGESVNGFINRAIGEAMGESPQKPAGAPQGDGAILTPAALKTAQEAAQRAGETVPAFVSRAVDIQAKRDEIMQGLKTKQEEGE